MNKSKQIQTSRVALAGFLHDIGKLAERARFEHPGNETRLMSQIKRVCPFCDNSHTHTHAAYTKLSMDFLDKKFPELTGDDMSPFTTWNSPEADDSLANCAAMHHKPGSFLQWIIATADRIASGFGKVEFEQYNRSSDQDNNKGPNYHYLARLLTQFEQISVTVEKKNDRIDCKYSYPLNVLSASSLFPKERTEIEYSGSNEGINRAQTEYKNLWEAFEIALNLIPKSHCKNIDLWIDHFDSCWLTFTQSIPSTIVGETIPDVSLYDHSKITAAFAAALWRYHDDSEHDQKIVTSDLEKRTGEYGWDEQKFLIVQGDFFGIQDFVFSSGSETNRKAAKILRGRSFSVSLLTDLAALKVLEKLNLPSTSQIINAAGKFLIVAPNTIETAKLLLDIEKELNAWFLKNTYGQQGIGLAWQTASPNDFLGEKFGELIKSIFEKLEEAKFQRNRLCSTDCPSPVFEGYLDQCGERGVCVYTDKLPGELHFEEKENKGLSKFAYDQIRIGESLTQKSHILISKMVVPKLISLKLDYFGYNVHFMNYEESQSDFSNDLRSGNIMRIWDLSTVDAMEESVFNGFARRFINTYVPEFDTSDIVQAKWSSGKYGEWDNDIDYGSEHRIKTLDHIACEDKTEETLLETDEKKWKGVSALAILKGDIDNLGLIFQSGLAKPTFAKWAALSRQINFFFTIYLPVLFKTSGTLTNYRNTYTVFAGGDDFFLIGPWLSTQKLANEMRNAFRCYTVNPQITFSAGISFFKPGETVRSFAENAEQDLECAKGFKITDGTSKNAVHLWGKSMKWDEFDELLNKINELGELQKKFNLSQGYIYDLLRFADMVNSEKIEDTIWRARFTYQTVRNVKEIVEAKNLVERIGNDLGKYGGNYRIVIHNHLYKQRKC
jgi:CRISPR-associated protein Csm1